MSVTRQSTLWQSLGGGGDPSPSISVTKRRVECVGPSFLSFYQSGSDLRARFGTQVAVDDSHLQYHQDPDFGYLRCLDPNDWRNQDHYAVLGLKKLRHRANQDDIKKAYRSKMLIHHPDKRKHVIVRVEDDYFSCITRAWEVLGNPKARRSYDSVDTTLDDSIPTNNKYNKEHFYCVFSKAFERNAHWSKIQPVPELGGPASTREQVEEFYSFWYDFQSWREFTYPQDDDRDVAEEKKLRKYEVSRIRKLVDLAYALDPRISVFKQEERDRKAAVKQFRKDQARKRLEEAAEKLEVEQMEARLEMERQEDHARGLQEALTVERSARKRAVKRSRAKLRKLVRANGYYVVDSEELVAHMMALEDIINNTPLVDTLEQLVQALSQFGREAFLKAIKDVKCNSSTTLTSSKKDELALDTWTENELQLLAKAVKLYPCERKFRWELVADFVNQSPAKNAKTSTDVQEKWSALQSSLPCEAARTASSDGKQDTDATLSDRAGAVADRASETLWSETELEALQTAKGTYPAFTPGRWDKIASAVGTRSRDQCLKEAKRKST